MLSLVAKSHRKKKTKKKIQIKQNKCLRLCLRLDKMYHITLKEFTSINWLPYKERVHQFFFHVCQ